MVCTIAHCAMADRREEPGPHRVEVGDVEPVAVRRDRPEPAVQERLAAAHVHRRQGPQPDAAVRRPAVRGVPGPAEDRHVVASVDQPRRQLLDVPLDAAGLGGDAAQADHRDAQMSHGSTPASW
jgi:hypothetical protein